MLSRRKPLARSTKPLKRSPIKKKLGRVGKLRAKGNKDAREQYFELHAYPESPDFAPCQACNRPMKKSYTQAHHKKPKGEELENKLACHSSCHQFFIHERSKPERRLKAQESPVNVLTGGCVDWGELQEDLDSFNRSDKF